MRDTGFAGPELGPRPNRFATAGDDGAVLVWDADKAVDSGSSDPSIRALIGRLEGHEGPVLSVAYCAAEGPLRLASGGSDKTIRIWRPEVLEADKAGDIHEACLVVLQGHTDAVNSVHFSPDGTLLASGSQDQTIRVWNPKRGNYLRSLNHHTDAVRCVAWRPHGKRLASGGDDRTVRIFNMDAEEEGEEGEELQMANLRGHRSPVLCVAWRSDGWRLASGSADRDIRVWDPYTKTVVVKLTEHASHITALAWPPHGRYLASGSSDKTVRNWDADPKAFAVELMQLTGHTADVNGLSWSPDAKVVATVGDETIRLWYPYPKRCALAVLTGHTGLIRAISWLPPVPREAPERPDSA